MESKISGGYQKPDYKQSQAPGKSGAQVPGPMPRVKQASLGQKFLKLFGRSAPSAHVRAPSAVREPTPRELLAARAHELVVQLFSLSCIEDGHNQVLLRVIFLARMDKLPKYEPGILNDLFMRAEGRGPVVARFPDEESKPLLDELNRALADLGVFPHSLLVENDADALPARGKVPGGPDPR